MTFRTAQKSTSAGDRYHVDADAVHFSALMAALDTIAEAGNNRRPLPSAPPTDQTRYQVRYSENDHNQFAALMADADAHSPAHRTPVRNHSNRHTGDDSGYTERDDQHFDRLMSFRSSLRAQSDEPGKTAPEAVALQHSATDNCGYLPQDLETFDTLMPTAVATDNATDRDIDHQPDPATSLTDVATQGRPIRIIDYDKQRQLDNQVGRRLHERGDAAMKIRFFD